MFCVYCGKKIPDGAKFCPFCGHSIDLDDHRPSQNKGMEERVVRQQAKPKHVERAKPQDPFKNLKVDEEVYQGVQKRSTIGSLIIIAVIIAVNFAVFGGYRIYASMNRNVITLSSFTPAYTVDGSKASIDVSNSRYGLKGSKNQSQADDIRLSADDFSFSQSEDLQNGDQVTVSLRQYENKDENYIVKGSKTFTVKFDKDSQENPNQEQETTNHSTDDDYMFENSDTTELTEDDLNTLTKKWMVRVAINEIYARHGYTFSNSTIADYFNNKSWYSADASVTSDDDVDLNQTEKDNLAKLKNYRDEQGWSWDISDPLNTDE